MRIRTAEPDEALSVRRILDAAMLEPGDVAERTAEGDVLVAVGDDGAVAGALVLATEDRAAGVGEGRPGDRGRARSPSTDGARIAAIAVRRRRRDRGIGTALVDAALEREGRLTARFDESVVSFYESIGFDVAAIGEGRYAGELAR